MTYLRNELLTPSEARSLIHHGFILVMLKLMLFRPVDLYKVYVR